MKIKNKSLAIITQLIATYQYDEALEKIETVEKIEQETHTPQERIMLSLLKVKIYEKIGLHNLAVEAGEKALRYARKEKTSVFITKAIIALIDPLTRIGKLDVALDYIIEAEE